ncbi:MAG: type III-B CRISPR module-associated protein Cmr5 [Candidatus Korarchaeota archaeon]
MSLNPTAKAVEMFMKVKAALNACIKDNNVREEVKRSIRARSREIPTMMMDIGLVPVLSFLLAKSGIDNLRKAANLIENLKTKCLERMSSEEKVDVKDFSYGVYAYVILKYLEEYLRPKERVESKELPKSLKDSTADKEQLADYVEKYLEFLLNGVNSQIALRILGPYLEQFKRLCEAEFPKESRD